MHEEEPNHHYMTAALAHAGSMAGHANGMHGDLPGDGERSGDGLGDVGRGLPVDLVGTVKKVGVLPN